MAGSGYLEMDAALALEGDLTVIERPRGARQAEVLDELGPVDPPELARPAASADRRRIGGAELSRSVLLLDRRCGMGERSRACRLVQLGTTPCVVDPTVRACGT